MMPCTISTTTSRRTRPSSSETREAGETRIRSTTPLRISDSSPKPTNAAPKIPSCTSRPGTNTCQASPGGNPGDCTTFSSSGPNSAR